MPDTNQPLTGDEAAQSATTPPTIDPVEKMPNVTELFAALFPQSGPKAEQTVVGPASAPFAGVPTWAWLVGGGLVAWLILSK